MLKLIGFSLSALILFGCSVTNNIRKQPGGEWSSSGASNKLVYIRYINSPVGRVAVKMFGTKNNKYFECNLVQIVYPDQPGRPQQFAGFETKTPLPQGELPFQIKDMNFDDKVDFRFVSRLTPERTVLYLVWVYDPVQGSYRRSTLLEKLPSPQFDSNQKQVLSSWTTTDQVRKQTVYRVSEGKLLLIYRSEMVPVRPGVFRQTVTRRVNGELQKDEPVLRYQQ